jgi:hypothetical protein
LTAGTELELGRKEINAAFVSTKLVKDNRV